MAVSWCFERYCSVRESAGDLRGDSRAVGRTVVFGLLGILVVGVAVFLAFGGPILDGDTGPPTESDTTPSDGVDGDEGDSDDSESDSDSDAETGGEDESDGEDDGDPDSGEDGGDSEDSSDGDDGGDGENETERLVDVSVELDAADRPIEEGDGNVTVYNMTSEEAVMRYDFSDGTEFTLPNATFTTTYEFAVNLSYYPAESIRHQPRLSGTAINETIGYEFQGAESWKSDWEVDQRPDGIDIDDPRLDHPDLTLRGYSAFDAEGNSYRTWSGSSEYESRYAYVAANNVSYKDRSRGSGDWRQHSAHWGKLTSTREIAASEGLGGVDRQFVDVIESSSFDSNEYHIYRVSEGLTGDTFIAHVNPETGYTVYIERTYEAVKPEEQESTRSIAEIYAHDEDVDPFPDDFPIEEIRTQLEDN